MIIFQFHFDFYNLFPCYLFKFCITGLHLINYLNKIKKKHRKKQRIKNLYIILFHVKKRKKNFQIKNCIFNRKMERETIFKELQSEKSHNFLRFN